MLLLLLTPGAVAWAGSNDVSSNRTSLSLQTNNVKTEGVVVDYIFRSIPVHFPAAY